MAGLCAFWPGRVAIAGLPGRGEIAGQEDYAIGTTGRLISMP